VFLSCDGSVMGHRLAMGAARRGIRVSIVDIDKARVDAARSEFLRSVAVATSHVGNVGDAAAMDALGAGAYQAHGDVHPRFDNAGVHLDGVSLSYSETQWKWLMDIDLMGVVHEASASCVGCSTAGRKGSSPTRLPSRG
jgi:NADP-dependent 3-hydroxy acid dehydrogenase YdfG